MKKSNKKTTKQSVNKYTLEKFKMNYEDLKFKTGKVIKTSSKKVVNKVNKVTHPSKKSKKPTKAELELAKKQYDNAIIGIGLLLVVVSIAYSTSVILLGVDSLGSKIALLPQAIFALVISIKAFSRLYK